MKISFRAVSLFLVIMLSGYACTANKAKQEEQAAAYRELAEAYYIDRRYTMALRELLKAEKLKPESPLIQNNLGLVYMAKNKLGLAEQHIKRAIEIKPDYAEAINNLATVYLQQEAWDEAIFYLDQLAGDMLYATPQYPLLNLGWAYFNKKDYASSEKYYTLAIKHYKEGFAKDYTYIQALGGLGRTYIATGKISQALASLGTAVKHAPNIPDTYYYIGLAYEKAGRPKDAKMAYLKVIDLAPDSEIANKAARAALKLQ